MSDLVRFGVAMERALLTQFDARIAERGYENRSEALRDLVRAELTRAAFAQGSVVVATLSVVYTTSTRAELASLLDPDGSGGSLFLSSMHVRIDRDRCLDTIVLRGKAEALGGLAGRIAGTKGVLSCELTVAAAFDEVAAGQTPGK